MSEQTFSAIRTARGDNRIHTAIDRVADDGTHGILGKNDDAHERIETNIAKAHFCDRFNQIGIDDNQVKRHPRCQRIL